MNFVPTPCVLSTWMLPPISSIMDFTIGRPSPVPATLFSVVVCSLENSSKICGRYSSLMPIPVSSQVKINRAYIENIPPLMPENKRRTADTYVRTVLLHYCSLVMFFVLIPSRIYMTSHLFIRISIFLNKI